MSGCSDRECRLRASLKKNPNSGKLLAQLSTLLTEKAKETKDEALQMEALGLARKAVLLCPTRPAGFLALSTASQNHRDQIDSLQTAVDLWNPLCSMKRSALAGALVRLLVEPREEEARQSRESIAKTAPQHPSRRNLSDSELNLYGRIQESLRDAWEQDTTTEEALVYTARAEYKLGLFFRKVQPSDVNQPRCIQHLKTAAENLPDNHALKKTAQFWLATLSENQSQFNDLDRCPKEYIVSLYSSFAENFDDLLVNKLNYETPKKLRQLLNSVAVVADHTMRWRAAADLGCGTGLSGVAFRDCVDALVGVDLSPEMIAKAKERKCYDSLVVGDAASILTTEKEFDLIVSCDVFVYIGNLLEIFTAAHTALTSTGLFAFSTECLGEEQAGDHPYVLQACARFAHKVTYIESLARAVGFQIIKLERTEIRKNGGKDVQGILVVMRHSSMEVE